MVRSGFNGFVDYLFIVNALTNVRNGWMRFESGSRPFKIASFENMRPRNELHKMVSSIPGTQNAGSRNSLLLILRPKTSAKNTKPRKYIENQKNPEILLPRYT